MVQRGASTGHAGDLTSIGYRRAPSWTRWMLQSVRSRLPALLVYVADTATLKIVSCVGREGARPLGHHGTCQMAEYHLVS